MWASSYYLHCMVCSRALDFKCIPSDKVVEGLCDDFATFCSYISELLKVDVKPEFDFHQEPFPFCQSCTSKVTLLRDYNAQIRQLQEHVEVLLRQVAANVVESFEDPRNAHFVDNNRIQDVKRPHEISDTFWKKIDEFRRKIFQHFNPWVPVPSVSGSENNPENAPQAPSGEGRKIPSPSQYIFRKEKIEVLESEENESFAEDNFFDVGFEESDPKTQDSENIHDLAFSSRPKRAVKRRVSWAKLLGDDEEYLEKVAASPEGNGEDCVEVEPLHTVEEDWQFSDSSYDENWKRKNRRKSVKPGPKCSKQKSSKSTYIPREHRRCLVPRIPCDHCHRTFMSKSILEKHMLLEHTKREKSSQEALSSAATSMKIEAENDPNIPEEDENMAKPLKPPEDLTCHICGKVLKTRYYLNMHLMRHDGITRHKCKTCNRGFLTKYCLTLHERTHTGERPNTCPTCGKTFKSNSQLSAHKFVHLKDDESAERPFMCEVCPKRFFEKKSLLKHQEIHKGEGERTSFKCDEDQCERAFFSSKSLMRHKKIAHDPNHWNKRGPRCQYCKLNFKSHLLLVDHLKLHYDGKLPGGNLQGPAPVQLVRVVRKKSVAVQLSNRQQSPSKPIAKKNPNDEIPLVALET